VKGVILAGGLGTRLHPATKVTNKHLLPIYDKPMIFYPLETLLKAGIKEILIVTGPEYSGHFLNLLGNGKELGAKFAYELQSQPGGIAQAVGLAKDFVGDEKFVVILGDNVFEDDISEDVREFENSDYAAKIFLKEVPDAERFGVAEIDGNIVKSVEEKPKAPKSKYAVVGLYMYPPDIFDIIKGLKPSARGQLEITDVNNHYVNKGVMKFRVLKGFWSDAGTPESLFRAAEFIRSKRLLK